MTPLHWTLAGTGLVILASLTVLLVYDVAAMVWGWRTLSGYGAKLPRLLCFLLGLAVGLVLGIVAGHLWWPMHG